MKNSARMLGLTLAIGTPMATASEQVMLVLDASGSMWGLVEGRSKVEIARTAVADLVQHWKPGVDLGLVAYGHRRKGDCTDIETLIAAAPLDAKGYLGKVNGLAAKGMTPLSQAVIHAADALKASEQKATVILISDGEETCDLDPCAVGKKLETSGVDFTAHVIGFDVPNPAHQAQLRCLAENTGGRYFNAADAGALEKALAQVAVAATEKPLPAVPATLKPPAELVAATQVTIEFDGPAEVRDWIGFAPVGSNDDAYLGYAWTTADKKSVTVRVPAQAGPYELRYVSGTRRPPVLARVSVDVKPAFATITGPASAMAGDLVEIEATGPFDPRHWVGFAPKGGDASAYRDYARLAESGPTKVELTAPSVAGEYELRFVLNESEKVAAAQPIRILPAQARLLEPPTKAKVSEPLLVDWSGPTGKRHWVGFIRKGGTSADYLSYAYTNTPSPARLPAPDTAGDYELVYVLAGEGGEQILVRHPVRVD